MLFQELIKTLRHKLAMSQCELANELNIDQTSISFYERGERKPTFRTIRKVVDAAKRHSIKVEYSDITIN